VTRFWRACLRCGVKPREFSACRSFVDQGKRRRLGRLHKRANRAGGYFLFAGPAGLTNINIDLIAGLPPPDGRKAGSFLWRRLLQRALPHVSVYMLEVDEDSRLGRELLAGGTRLSRALRSG